MGTLQTIINFPLRYEFLEDHNESEVGGIPRHWMDQQVFNKFVQKKIFHASSDLVHGLYESQVFWNPRSLVRETNPVRIRILNPVIVAHGMNYFWLRAHERPGQERCEFLHMDGGFRYLRKLLIFCCGLPGLCQHEPMEGATAGGSSCQWSGWKGILLARSWALVY